MVVEKLNLAKTVWEEVGSKIEIVTKENQILRYRLLDIVADEIKPSKKVTKLWNSEKSKLDKSGKATEVDRVLMICPELSNPVALISNRKITWCAVEDCQ